MSSKSDKIDKLLIDMHKLEKEFNEKVDRLLHKYLPYHFGRDEFRARGTNIYSEWVVDRLAALIKKGDVDSKTLDPLQVNGKPIHVKKPHTKRKKQDYEQTDKHL